jgi:hypothetical protein
MAVFAVTAVSARPVRARVAVLATFQGAWVRAIAFRLLATAIAPLAFIERCLGIAVVVASAVSARPVRARVAILATFRGAWGLARACRRYLGEGSDGRQSPLGEQEGLSKRGSVSPWGV